MYSLPLFAVVAWSTLFPGLFLAKAGAQPDCDTWLQQTTRGADKRSEMQWRDWTITALGDACDAIPTELREAAARVRGMKDRAQRARILATAASSVLGPACPVPEPLTDARTLAAQCPLPPNLRFRLGDAELSDIRAVDYAILAAMVNSLIGANHYTEEAERVMLNFTLSAEIVGERDRTSSRGRSKGR